MHLVLIGLNYKTAPVELREKLSISKDQLPDALSRLTDLESVVECAVLSTCNRMEIYAYTGSKACDAGIIESIGEFCGVPQVDFESCTYSRSGHKAVEHLFRVAAGIDSMILGESQILGQVKEAYASANLESATGPVLNTLFQQSSTVGKRSRTETAISRGAFSVGSAAVQLARSIFDELKGRTVLVVGAGKMAELTIDHLTSSGASQVMVTNRTHEKAVELAEQFDGRPIRFEDMASALETADIVISSTGAKETVIDRKMIASAMHARRGRPLFLIDIAVPRDVEKGAADIENVFLYNIDDLQAVVEANSANRQAEVGKVEAIVRQEVEQFMEWFRTLDAVPVITALRDKFEQIRLIELEGLNRKLSHLPPEDIEAINAATRSIVNRICHQPILQIKEYAMGVDSATKLEVVCKAFGIPASDAANEEVKQATS